jgi:hypothetical protein
VTGICALAIFLPPMLGSFGLSLKGSDGLALTRTYAGEITAVDKICAGIPHGTSVLIIDHNMWWQWGQPIRGMCDVPVAGVQTSPPEDKGQTVEPATMVAAVKAIIASGHRPLVLAPTQDEFAPLMQAFGNGTVKFLMAQNTSIDEHTIFGTPHNSVPQSFTAYSWEPSK